jgi:hypothetical protein
LCLWYSGTSALPEATLLLYSICQLTGHLGTSVGLLIYARNLFLFTESGTRAKDANFQDEEVMAQ